LKSWFLGLMAISDQSSKYIDNEIDGRTMARMLDLGDILELIIDGLDQDSFAEQDCTCQNGCG
jgi:hypothetical protein